jgi:hypothetical protein
MFMRRKAVRGALLAALLVATSLVVTSCGGGSDSTSVAEQPSKEEFTKRADQICSKTEKRQLLLVDKFQEKRRAEGKGTPPSAAEEAEVVVAAGLPPIKKQLQELEDLPLPATGAKEASKYIEALEAAVKAAEKDPQLLLSLESTPFAQAAKVAQAFGFSVCSGA